MGWGAVKRALFGSVSTGVLHHAKCPVLIVRGEAMDVAAAAEGADERALSDAPLSQPVLGGPHVVRLGVAARVTTRLQWA
jgi:hypothetical protein